MGHGGGGTNSASVAHRRHMKPGTAVPGKLIVRSSVGIAPIAMTGGRLGNGGHHLIQATETVFTGWGAGAVPSILLPMGLPP